MGVRLLVLGALLVLLVAVQHVGAQITDPAEVSALEAIKGSLKDPRKFLRNWNQGDPCTSNWTGVSCFNTTENDGYLHVSELHLLNMNLSGSLSPELGKFSYMKILDFMWNQMSGSIPKEVGNIKSLELLLLNGNQLTGSLPDELGFLPNLNRIQIDQNHISGPIPKTFANLNKTKHFHMNNNSISGFIPSELSVLPSLVHFLLDNNNLSGNLPPELSELPQLLIFQVDNNQFEGTIPASYGNMSKLLKLSLRNCSLQGPVPDLSRIPSLGYLDLSRNQLNGSIPSNKLSDEITTIDMSYNNLNGPIPANLSGLPLLQRLSLENNSLSGVVPSTIWQNRTFNGNQSLLLDFQNNGLSNISGSLNPPTNVTIMLQGNPVCQVANQLNIAQFCISQTGGDQDVPTSSPYTPGSCLTQSCPQDYEYVENAPVPCFCAAPLRVGYRLKSPGFSDFLAYEDSFEVYLTRGLALDLYQLSIASFIWEEGPRLRMYLKLFPEFNNQSNTFNEMVFDFPKSGISKGAISGIVVGSVAGAIILTAVVFILIMRRKAEKQRTISRKRRLSRIKIKVDGVQDFTFVQMALATNNFNNSTQIGQGGYGKVYRGILADGSIVAIKRALEGSLQGEKEFLTEIELLSRVHHRNLVALMGFCDEEGEQMLVYEFMPNGTLRDLLSVKSKEPLDFAMRLRIALGSARGILYLHKEADPPIFHRDIKASNILLDSRLNAKVADFGLSKLAPVPNIEGDTPAHISTVVKGTPGYLDPEYFLTHKLTDKSDVYSLGVVFLELLTGMHPISHGKNIVREVNLAYQSGMIFSVIDDRMGSYPSECVERFVTLALNCCKDETDARPSMADIVRQLENIWLMMPESDKGTSQSMEAPPKKGTPPSSTSITKNPYVSADVSGSDLHEIETYGLWSSGLVAVELLKETDNICQVRAQTTDPTEVTALRAIKKSLNDPTKYLRNWNKGDPCTSNWAAVLCFNFTHNDGYLHVRELLFLNMNLSGSLSPELGRFSYLQILDFMWNKISGSIPKEIGKITSLELLLLNGNQLTGSLPEELGFLPNLNRLQIDENYISGPIPKSFANMKKAKHFHMNNNTISGHIPSELSKLPMLVHFLLDNNDLSGYLPPEFAEMPRLQILQLDNNRFDGAIPASYENMSELLKLTLRNCSLQGAVPDLSRIPKLGYLDLSWNHLNGSIPANKLSDNITTIDLSFNNLSGPIPANFSGLPRLQRLSLENNSLSGVVPSTVWRNRIFNATESLLLDFQNNLFSNISGRLHPPANVTIRLRGNPVCEVANQLNIVPYCRSQTGFEEVLESSKTTLAGCQSQLCPEYYEFVENSPVPCFCAVPLKVGYRMKSPGFSDFLPYEYPFEVYITSGLKVNLYQLHIDSFSWEAGPRLRMYLKLFPEFNNHSNTFNESEIRRIRSMFTGWTIPDTPENDIFGPHELLNFTLSGPYTNVVLDFPRSGISKGALVAIVLGAIAVAIALSATVSVLIMRRHAAKHCTNSRKRHLSNVVIQFSPLKMSAETHGIIMTPAVSSIRIKIDGVQGFSFGQMELATNKFNISTQIGQGGYGKVYKGILDDGTIVAVKRALLGSLQGEKEFLTEIELLSRVHHRNLVSLIGYCDEEDEQMLVYEFLPNGTLRDHLSVKSNGPLGFALRLRIALGSAKGILYLHNEADPPIFHRDIKASNILLDSKFNAKVADFGLSRLAPVPDIEGTIPGHVSTVVKGTPGYLDPEYFLTHKLTDKSDVYSLGVVFLELLTGSQPITHGKNIVREVRLAYQSGVVFSVIDGRMGSYPSECAERFVTLALNCCQDVTDARPSMADVVRELENIWLMMPESDTGPSESKVGESETGTSSSSTWTTSRNPYVSSDVSGSDLVSGVMTAIAPR
ncbi:hypothetical protein IFM89_005337 [Coptis chinensis]|uniref:non-specific serine/threonine protein kinase n=1 Tax=Coptis chinensis TaxID=261450 RepID=A0A835HAQ9_9MAGN|nr:hypothetical protein IFM89_005337 [Coptis chinensis]